MANQTQFEEFYLSWGAAYLPEIERELLRVGFKETDSKQRIIISITEVLKK